MKAKVTVTSVAVATTKFLLGMYTCTVDSDVGTGVFSLVLEILHVLDMRMCDRTCLWAWTACNRSPHPCCSLLSTLATPYTSQYTVTIIEATGLIATQLLIKNREKLPEQVSL